MYIKNDATGISDKQLYKHVLRAVKLVDEKKGIKGLLTTKISEESALKIKDLHIIDCKNINFDFLKFLPNLEHLMVSDCTITNVQGLQYTPNLTLLTFYDSYVDDLTPVGECRKLEMFDYVHDDNQDSLDDFSFLSNLNDLVEVDLTGNKISDISFLSNKSKLKEVVLTNNPIKDLHVLSTLKQMHYLEIEDCNLTNLDGLEKCEALMTLYANGNNFDEELKEKYQAQFAHLRVLQL